ncbi:MAG TPA: HNH endonuclease signature motif containing protein [Acidimicrobiales bacterium]|nr:HNH endonuclease signature motif containing protein [Acidimicrobiales bacterium]
MAGGGAAGRRADALMALARTPDADPVPAADRHMVHHLLDHATGDASLLDGTPEDVATLAAVCCDATHVTHLVDPTTAEPLALGRARRTWSTAQRRAIAVRDGGRCRWPGFEHRTTDVRHVLPWEHGGGTDVTNGALVCPRHHTLTHAGWTTTGTATEALTWHAPDGTPIGSTAPLRPFVRALLVGRR